MLKSVIFVSVIALCFSASASELKFNFDSPSFSGSGKSTHYLTIENIEKTRSDAIEAQKKADAKALKDELNSNIFLRCDQNDIKIKLNMKNQEDFKVFEKVRDLKDVF